MEKLKCQTLVALMLAWASPVFSQGPQAPLRVGMDTRLPPWSYVPGLDYSSENMERAPRINAAQLKRLVGLDVDVSEALARRLGRELMVVPVAWFDIENALLAGKFDLIVNGWTPGRLTPDGVVASSPYYEWGLLAAVRSDNKKIRDFSDLRVARVGHYRSQVVERTLVSLSGTRRSYDSADVLFDDLKAGLVDAAVYDSPYVHWRVANDASLRVVGRPLNRLGYHVGVRRDDTALLAAVEVALKDLASSPDMRGIRKTWDVAP